MSEIDGGSGSHDPIVPHEGTLAAADSARSVFVSYASQNADFAKSLVEALEREQLSCWIAPRDVTPGALYADGIIRAITAAQVFVLVLSKSAIESKHVGKEVERASSKGLPVVTLRIDSAPLTPALEYFLSESQWIDVEPSRGDEAFTQVINALKRHLSADRSTVSPKAPTRMGSGIKQSSIDHRSRLRASKPLFVVVGVITLFLIYLSVAAVRHSKERVPEKLDQVVSVPASITPPPIVVSDKSVAVLPFVDMSEKKDQEYFSDGLSEELIDMLTKVAELRVPARTSSFYFKGKSEDISTIAKRLLVAHVLEGSVRKSGNQMRITVQLVRADSGYHLWSQTYDRKVDDVFRVQDEIAAAVVKALKVSLLEASPPQAAPTSSTEAYLTYLKGSAHFRRSTPMDYEESVVLLKQALKLDPNYAPAWGLLARALRAQVIDGHATYADLSKPIRAAASRAVDLDPNLSDAYVALASSYLIDWQWDEVDIALKKALELQPGNPLALKYASFLATSRGQTDLALRFAEDALARDPLDYSLGANLVSANEDAGRYEEAEARFRLDLALNPTQPYVHSSISWFKFMQGNPAAALDEIEQEPDESNRLSGRVIYLDALGRHAEADAALALYTKKYASTNPFTVASLNARRGNGDQAFEWLERAYRLHDDNVADLHNSTGFKNLRADPRYKAMRRKMHLPE